MSAGWTRRRFEGFGLTQSPPGPHLQRFEDATKLAVILCIDISGSMAGQPLEEARAGALRFVDEAFDAGYEVAVLTWESGVRAYSGLDSSRREVEGVITSMVSTGGNSIEPVIDLCDQELTARRGDRVVVLFTDGAWSWGRAAAVVETMKEAGVRFIGLGLGASASANLQNLAPAGSAPVETTTAGLADAMAGIAKIMKPNQSRG